MTLEKYKYPIVFLGAQGKCGKVYMANLLKHAIRKTYYHPERKQNVHYECGKVSHEWLVKPMNTAIITGWHEPLDILKNKYKHYNAYKFENSLNAAQNIWDTWTTPKIKECVQKGIVVDAESRFLALSYYFVRRQIHPDNIKIIIMRRPVHSIAYQNCRVAAYKVRNNRYYLGNLVPPWCRNNLTVPHKPIDEITQQELNVWSAFEIEERKKQIRNYFPDVDIMEWDMETDSKSRESLEHLVDFVSSKHQKIKTNDLMKGIIDRRAMLHLGPTKCAALCPDKEHCTEEDFEKLVGEYKLIYNTEKRREGLL